MESMKCSKCKHGDRVYNVNVDKYSSFCQECLSKNNENIICVKCKTKQKKYNENLKRYYSTCENCM